MPSPTPPAAEHRHRLDAFVARVRALPPAGWGRLDAIGERFADNTPWARLRRARLDADRFALFGANIIARPVVVGGAVILGAAKDAGRWLRADPPPDPFRPPRRRIHAADEPLPDGRSAFQRGWDAYWEHHLTGLAELRRLARESPARGPAPDGGAAAIRVLELGFQSLWMRGVPGADPAVLDRLYAPVEPVIPLASLDGTQPRLPAATP